jgi:ribonucleotide reductase alpha subunit
MAIERGPFICQTQSMNLFFEEPNHKNLSSSLFYGWEKGLKTGSYYIRSKPKAQAQQFTIAPKETFTIADGVCESCSA